MRDDIGLKMTEISYKLVCRKFSSTPLNYHSVVNVHSKLPIVLISPLKLPKIVNIPPKTKKQEQNGAILTIL